MKRFYPVFALVVILALALSGCNLPAGEAPAESTPGLSALEISASQTAAAPSSTLPPTETPSPLPSDTPAATLTFTPSPEPTITETPTVGVLLVNVLRETNCRSGPGSMYDRVAIYQANTQLELIAKDLGGGFWFVRNPANPAEECWVLGSNLDIKKDLDTSGLPAFTPPPSPTPGVEMQAKFKNYDKCGDRFFMRFEVVNTGGIPFRSYYLKVTDLKKNTSLEFSAAVFHLTVGCIIAKDISPLAPGSTGYLQTGYDKPDMFKTDPRINNLRAVLMVCAEKNLQAPCLTQVLEIKNK